LRRLGRQVLAERATRRTAVAVAVVRWVPI
jgi:hypothetical protein